jgi:hypothetical protein
VVIAIGFLFAVFGLALYANIAGAADFAIKNLTSRSLGSLAPGFAASRSGFRVYASLLISIGTVLIGLGSLDWAGLLGALVASIGVVSFVLFSIAAIVGEVATYRALKR